jgi:hypothetical protein
MLDNEDIIIRRKRPDNEKKKQDNETETQA